MLRALNKKEGFTLIELLIVVAIIGILAAIAIPQFAAYRERAYCSSIQSDLANAAIAEEAYFVDNSSYTGTIASLIGFSTTSPNVTLSIAVTAGTSTVPTYFTATGTHSQCAGGSTTYTWNSGNGGLV